MAPPQFKGLKLERRGDVYIVTLHSPPENRLTQALCEEVIAAFRFIAADFGPKSPGAVVTTTTSEKFFCTGLDLNEAAKNPYANTDGFYPMLYTILDFPFPTVACVTGHVFGGGCPFALAHDYRVMNSRRGFWSMPPVDLGLHFDGIGALPRLKTSPRIARRMLLEAHRWTGVEAEKDGIVDAVAEPDKMLDAAVEIAQKWAPKAKGGVYGLLRDELWGEARAKIQGISYVRSRQTSREALAKI